MVSLMNIYFMISDCSFTLSLRKETTVSHSHGLGRVRVIWRWTDVTDLLVLKYFLDPLL